MPSDESADTVDRRYRDEEWLKMQKYEKERTVAEIGEICGVGHNTISSWMRKYGLGDRQKEYDLSDVEIPEQAPWKYEELLRTLYVEKRMSTTDISHAFDCSSATVLEWMDSYGIDRRDRSTAQENTHGTTDFARFSTNVRGWESWVVRSDELFVHRLLAVAEYGFEAVCDKDIHHKNGIKWDNRLSNLELVDNVEHQKKHKKVIGVDRLRVAELYENGDMSSRKLASHLDLDITQGTVLAIHKEHYGESAS